MITVKLRSNDPELDGAEVTVLDYHEDQVLCSLVECPKLSFYWDRACLQLTDKPMGSSKAVQLK